MAKKSFKKGAKGFLGKAFGKVKGFITGKKGGAAARGGVRRRGGLKINKLLNQVLAAKLRAKVMQQKVKVVNMIK